ncbi:MAG TPA: DNA-3-methyladenine glycosylase I [Steroidobacteraceae bacterium]|nr:DNA-3-methyladenine glycosylase I [Steroidobacteraceae bacterium]
MARESAAARRAVVRHADGQWRCAWCADDPLYVRYHDTEWGVPLRDDDCLFEMLCLEGAQAGLSWITILRKRDSYRRAFDAFDAHKMARYTPRRIERLLADPGIVRNRLKVKAFVLNARAYLDLKTRDGSFAEYLWRYAPAARRRRPRYLSEIPATTAGSEAMSDDLRRRGFKFVGSTICYAFMQAVGIVDDHQQGCLRASPAGARSATD